MQRRKAVMLAISPPAPALVAGARRYGAAAGWRMAETSHIVGGAEGLCRWRGDGAVISLRTDKTMLDFAQRLRMLCVPFVDVSNERPDIDAPRVVFDDRAAGRAAAEYLMRAGYRNAAWFSTHWTAAHAERYAGFCETWALKFGAGAGPSRFGGGDEPRRWVLCESGPSGLCNDSDALSSWFARQIRQIPRPLALLCHDSYDAERAIDECAEAGVAVPGEVSVLATGDRLGVCAAQPLPISAVDSNGEEHGRAAAELLDRLMRGERPPPEPVFVPPGPVAVRASTDRTAAADPLVEKAQELIAANFARPWGASQLAAALGVATLKLNRHFKAELGRTPGAEILRHRIDRAKELLRDTALPLGQIAARCGFCNASWFCNMFRRETGLSPNAWRTSRHGPG